MIQEVETESWNKPFGSLNCTKPLYVKSTEKNNWNHFRLWKLIITGKGLLCYWKSHYNWKVQFGIIYVGTLIYHQIFTAQASQCIQFQIRGCFPGFFLDFLLLFLSRAFMWNNDIISNNHNNFWLCTIHYHLKVFRSLTL